MAASVAGSASPQAALSNTSFLARANSSFRERLSRSPNPSVETPRTEVRKLDVESKRMAGVVANAPGDYMAFVANDPSTAHTRIAQNVSRVVPELAHRTAAVRRFTEDVGYVQEELQDSIRSMAAVCDIPVFKSLHSKLFCAIDLARTLSDHFKQVAQSPTGTPRRDVAAAAAVAGEDKEEKEGEDEQEGE